MSAATKITHRVTLHFRGLSLTSVPFAQVLKTAEEVYAQYGIKLEFGSGMSLHLSAAEAKKYAKVDGQCKWKITSGEFAGVQKLGPPAPHTGIKVYFVKSFGAALLGCGGHAPNAPACICASTDLSRSLLRDRD